MAKKGDYNFKGRKLPGSFNTSILIRAFGDDEKRMASFLADYDAAKLKANYSREPNDKQYDIADLRLQGMTTSEIATKKNVTISQVSQAIHRVAVWQFLGNKKRK